MNIKRTGRWRGVRSARSADAARKRDAIQVFGREEGSGTNRDKDPANPQLGNLKLVRLASYLMFGQKRCSCVKSDSY